MTVPCPVSDASRCAVPANVKVSVADSTVKVEGPKGKLSFRYRPEIGVAYDEAAKQLLVTRSDDERAEPGPPRPDPQPDRQHGRRASPPATPRSWRSSASATRRSSRRRTPWPSRSATPTRSCSKPPPGVRVAVPDATHVVDHRGRQAGRRPVRRRRPQGPPPRALQGQGHPLRGRGRPPQGRQGVRLEVSPRDSTTADRIPPEAGRPVASCCGPVGIGRPEPRAKDAP